MFFKPKYQNTDKNAPISFCADTKISVPACTVGEFILSTLGNACKNKKQPKKGAVCASVSFEKGLPKNIADQCNATGNAEEYAISFGKETVIYANTERGWVYGAVTLAEMAGRAYCGLLYDYPLCSERGYRVYLPGKENIPVFKKMVDFLAEYKYNSVILEIGGAMEYKRHPEINAKWLEFCAEVYADPTRADTIQHKLYPWEKNSIHCENGDGGVLTQDECRHLADYCLSRGIEVIPEVPTLSHSDYICMAHPEIAERPEDKYADTYCPNHPDTYKYVFDVIDEVVEVFKPRQIHIGHDETYILGICERCRHTDPVELYVNDIKKIKAYLDGYNIKTSMWAEKLLRAFTAAGSPIGGTGKAGFRNGSQFSIPALWYCRDSLPRDIICAHWYWEFGKHHDKIYHERNMEMLFGNFSAIQMNGFTERREWGAKGGWVSNWGSFEQEYMQRNIQYFNLLSAADAFWNCDFDSDNKKRVFDRSIKEAYKYFCRDKKNTIVIKHRTIENIPHEFFWCGVFIDDEKYLLGNYEVDYADGTTVKYPVKYGTNIGGKYIANYPNNKELLQLAGAVLPTGENGELFYECAYEDENPDSEIVGIRYVPIKKEFTVEYGI